MILMDLHVHSSGISTCCRISGEKGVDFAKERGLGGFVLTNHYVDNYVGGSRHGTYEELASHYREEYRRVRDYGTRVGFSVLFGMEITAGWDRDVHLLVYGVDEQFVTEHPRVCLYSARELYDAVYAAGGILVQAHPYRRAPRLQDLSLLDGVEISCHPNPTFGGSFALQMLEIARENGKILTCGGDYHADVPYRPGCGVFLPEGVRDGPSLATYLKTAPELQLQVHEPGGEIFSLKYSRKDVR